MNETETQPTEQPFLSHLIELRERLLKAVAAILVCLLALLPFANRLYGWLARPLLEHLPLGGKMVAIDVASPFLTPLKLAFLLAIVLAMPIVLYQLWAFISPGLYRNEKRLAVPVLVSSVLLFYIGCAFAYFLVLPAVFVFMAGVAPEGVTVMPDISRFLDFAVVLFLAFGVCFEVPVVLIILVSLGMVSVEQLAKSRPYAIVGAFAIAAVLTPPDVFSQIMLAIPMCVLYEFGILAARVMTRHAQQENTISSP